MFAKRATAALEFLGLAFLLCGVLLATAPAHAGVLDASWTAPTTNTDGSALTDLAFYRLYYGTASAPCPASAFAQVPSPTASPETSRVRGLFDEP